MSPDSFILPQLLAFFFRRLDASEQLICVYLLQMSLSFVTARMHM